MRRVLTAAIILLAVAGSTSLLQARQRESRRREPDITNLPSPEIDKVEGSLEQVLKNRKSGTHFLSDSLSREIISKLAWAGQGITDADEDLRTVPSIDGTYPATLYFFTEQGIFRYQPDGHSLEKVHNEDKRPELSEAADDDDIIKKAPCSIVITGSSSALRRFSSADVQRLINIHTGQIAQNILMQAHADELAAKEFAIFDSRRIRRIARVEQLAEAKYIIAVGKPDVEAQEAAVEELEAEPDTKVVLVAPRYNFDDQQLFVTRNTLTDAGLAVDVASTRAREIVGEDASRIRADVRIDHIDPDDYDAVVFIGGYGAQGLWTHASVLQLASRSNEQGKIVGASGSAVMILANADLLQGRLATGDPELRERMSERGVLYVNEPVVSDSRIITSRNADSAERFAAAINEAIVEMQTEQ